MPGTSGGHVVAQFDTADFHDPVPFIRTKAGRFRIHRQQSSRHRRPPWTRTPAAEPGLIESASVGRSRVVHADGGRGGAPAMPLGDPARSE